MSLEAHSLKASALIQTKIKYNMATKLVLWELKNDEISEELAGYWHVKVHIDQEEVLEFGFSILPGCETTSKDSIQA